MFRPARAQVPWRADLPDIDAPRSEPEQGNSQILFESDCANTLRNLEVKSLAPDLSAGSSWQRVQY
jgi:hypothetical protein